MAQTNGVSGGNTPWKGDQAPCVYCGQTISRQTDRCPHCRTSFSLAVRKASREIIGPWYYLDPRNPSGRGVTFETLIKMIEKGRIRPDSIVRGPTTHQDWMYAAETPRLAKYLGMCPHCFAEAKPEDVYCTRCQLNMNQRPAEPRPGIPADLVKEPVHKASYEMEKELVRATAASEEAFSSETFEAPKPAPAPVPAPRPEAPSVPVSSAPSAVAAAAATAMADAGGAVDRQSRIAATRRRKPKVWIVFILTWVTLLPLLGVGILVDFGGMRGALMRLAHSGDGGPPDAGTASPTDEAWLNAQLAEVDKAEQSHDYDGAVTILRTIIDKTGDPKWRPTLESRIVGIRKKAADERKARLTKLTEKLNVARKMAEEGEYDSALDILRNIPADDRAFLASLTSPSGDSIAVNVEKMEAKIRDDQARYTLQKKQEEQLTALVLKANEQVTAKQWPQALETYKQIGATFPPEMLLKKGIDVDKTLKAIQSQIAAAPTPPTPTPAPPTPTPPTPTPPTPKPIKPATGTPEELAAAAKALIDEALALDKAEQFEPEVAKLEEIKARFEDKYWPPGLEDRIKQVKAKIEALKFFGMDGPKKGEKPPKTPPKTP